MSLLKTAESKILACKDDSTQPGRFSEIFRIANDYETIESSCTEKLSRCLEVLQ